MSLPPPKSKQRRRARADGDRRRQAILDAAARLATVEGLDGLSLSRLAEHIGMSKAGVYAHFGSKQELQLATIENANTIYLAEVVERASVLPEGRARLEALLEAFLSHLERDVFPGGCFFASAGAELATHPGPTKERIRELHASWMQLLEDNVRAAQRAGDLDRTDDPAQLAFELDSYLALANFMFLLYDSPQLLERAHKAIRARLQAALPGNTPSAGEDRPAEGRAP